MNCPYQSEMPYTYETYEKVYKRMLELMPGWFTMLDEVMDPHGPEPDIRRIATIITETGRDMDKVIHEEMEEDWFQYHGDYEEW